MVGIYKPRRGQTNFSWGYSAQQAQCIDLLPKRSEIMKTYNNIDFTPKLLELVEQFQREQQPIPVNFRELAQLKTGADRLTHLLHPYPAKLLPNIPYFFLNSTALAPPGSQILDPFCGTGTVLVEGLAAAHTVSGADANPLARLITKAKTAPISSTQLDRVTRKLKSSIPSRAPAYPDTPLDLKYWFPGRTLSQLFRLLVAIRSVGEQEIQDFLLANLSALIKRVSYADPRLSVPVRLSLERAEEYGPAYKPVLEHLNSIESMDVIGAYFRLVKNNAERLERLSAALMPWARRTDIFTDARELGTIEKQYDLIMTSPPYVGAQKYIRASSLSLACLGLLEQGQLRPLERKNIGREHYSKLEYQKIDIPSIEGAVSILQKIESRNALRAHIAANYLIEMRAAISEANLHLRPGGYLALVAGANLVCGEKFDTPFYLQSMAHEVGLTTELVLTDVIKSRGLMTKRNKTAGMINSEVVFLMRKSKWTKAK